MKTTLLTIFTIGLTACAATKPCVTQEPPEATTMMCELAGSNEEYTALVCTNESIEKFNTYIGKSKEWQQATWTSCGLGKKNGAQKEAKKETKGQSKVTQPVLPSR